MCWILLHRKQRLSSTEKYKVMNESDGWNKRRNIRDPYFCKITINRLDKIGPVSVGHIPREISRYVFYFLQETGSITRYVAHIHHRVSHILDSGLKIPILMYFVYYKKIIIHETKDFVVKQLDFGVRHWSDWRKPRKKCCRRLSTWCNTKRLMRNDTRFCK